MTIDDCIYYEKRMSGKSMLERKYTRVEHEQLAEWLKELKAFREAKDLCKKECGKCDLLQSYMKLRNELKFLREWKADIMESFGKYDCDSIEEVAHNAYNRGIDDLRRKTQEKLEGLLKAEIRGEDMCPFSEIGDGSCATMNADIGCSYCARDVDIKELNQQAEQLKEKKE